MASADDVSVKCLIVVLGKSLALQNGQPALKLELQRRLSKAAAIFHEKVGTVGNNPNPLQSNEVKIITSGGTSPKVGVSEASVMFHYLVFDCHIPAECIILEDRSLSTTLNAWNSFFVAQHFFASQQGCIDPSSCHPLDIAQLLMYSPSAITPSAHQYLTEVAASPPKFPQDCILVTSDLHSPRAYLIFEAVWEYLAQNYHATLSARVVDAIPANHTTLLNQIDLLSIPEIKKEFELLHDISVVQRYLTFNGAHPGVFVPWIEVRFNRAQAALNQLCLTAITELSSSSDKQSDDDQTSFAKPSCVNSSLASSSASQSNQQSQLMNADAKSKSSPSIGDLWVLVYHWDGQWNNKVFASESDAKSFISQRDYLTRDQAPRASRLLLNPHRQVVLNHFSNEEWRERTSLQMQQILSVIDHDFAQFVADESLSLSVGKFDCNLDPITVDYSSGSYHFHASSSAANHQCASTASSSDHSLSASAIANGGRTGYIRFEGSTIVMAASAKSVSLWTRFFNMISVDSSITCELFLLPPESYHVTLRGISEVFSQRSAANYNRDVIFSKFAHMLVLDQHFSDVYRAFNATVVQFGPAECGLDQMMGLLPEDCSRLSFASAADLHAEQMLRSLEQRAATDLGLNLRRRQSWHMTFGYYQSNKAWSLTEQRYLARRRKLAQVAMSDLFETFLESLSLAERAELLQFERPRVCWYHDMTKFNPIEFE